MAPDPNSAEDGAKLASPAKWQQAGANDAAVWGLCQGSGKQPYRTAVDRSNAATKCSCPSRKFPCKHALGLMFLHAEGRTSADAPPDWVTEWLTSRESARKRKEEKAVAAPDPAKQGKRRTRRAAAMAEGMAEARRWLADALRGGLEALRRRPAEQFSQMAARMVDAKTPGLADAVLRLSEASRRPDWERAMLGEAARLHMLLRRIETQPDDEDDRGAAILLGEAMPREEVLASARPEDGVWIVTGHHTRLEPQGPRGRMLVRRIWLARQGDGRPGLLLSFALPKQMAPLDPLLPCGKAFAGSLAFYPDGLRALIRERRKDVAAEPPVFAGLAEADAARRERLADDPWTERFPAVVEGVDPRPHKDGWLLADREGLAVPLQLPDNDPWPLLALTRGHPSRLSVEWDDASVRILTAWTAEGAVSVGGGPP